jgi:hypothetical protein
VERPATSSSWSVKRRSSCSYAAGYLRKCSTCTVSSHLRWCTDTPRSCCTPTCPSVSVDGASCYNRALVWFGRVVGHPHPCLSLSSLTHHLAVPAPVPPSVSWWLRGWHVWYLRQGRTCWRRMCFSMSVSGMRSSAPEYKYNCGHSGASCAHTSCTCQRDTGRQ